MLLIFLLLLSKTLLCEATDILTAGPTGISSSSPIATSNSSPDGSFLEVPIFPPEWNLNLLPRVEVETGRADLNLTLKLLGNSSYISGPGTTVSVVPDPGGLNGTVPASVNINSLSTQSGGGDLGLVDLNYDILGVALAPYSPAIVIGGYDENRVSQQPSWRPFLLNSGISCLNILAINGIPWDTSVSPSLIITENPELILPSGDCQSPLILTFEGTSKDDKYNVTIPTEFLHNDTSCLVQPKESQLVSYSLGLPFLQAVYLVYNKSLPGNFYFAPAILKPNGPISGKPFSIDSLDGLISPSDGASTTTTTVAATTTSSPQASTGSSGSSVKVGAIAGGVVGGVAVLLLLTLLILYLARRRRSDSPRAGYDKGGPERYSSMATPLESLPDIYESQYVQPPKQYDPVHPDSHASQAFTSQAVRGGGDLETPYTDVPESAIGIAVPGPTPLSPISMERSSAAQDLVAEIDGREVNGDGVSVRSASPGLDDPRKHSFMPSPNPDTQERQIFTRSPLFSRSRNEHGSAL